MQLKAIVIGSGWAGEGHTLALRAAGVDVAALCARSLKPALALANKLEIAEVQMDWRSAISELRPDIVAIATPAAPHREMAETAAQLGCHVFCDKPLALNAAEARAMLSAVRQAGVRHAYGPASCVAPGIDHARNLLADGLLGKLTGVESHWHLGVSRPLAYCWLSEVSQGGGMLNNAFTHKLAQVLRLTNGTPIEVAGEAECFQSKALIGPAVHDFRDLFRTSPDVDENDPSRWRPADADTAYSVMLRLSLPSGERLSARFTGSLTSKAQNPEYMVIFGTKGTLMLTGQSGTEELQHYDFGRDSWEQLTIPRSGADPEDTVQRNWNRLVGQFVADIRGDAHSYYPTFHDGWVAAEIIDIVRAGRGWAAVPA
jgi:predicted dehydrogenase